MVAPLIARTVIRKAGMNDRRRQRFERIARARRQMRSFGHTQALETPYFPIMIFLAALTKDIFDLSVILSFVSTPLMAGLLLLWRFNKNEMMRKSTRGWFVKRYILTMFLETLSLGLLPVSSILVWMTHKKEVGVTQRPIAAHSIA